MHEFPFHEKVEHIWKATDFLKLIFKVFAIFDIGRYMPTVNYSTFLLTIHSMNFLIFLILLDTMYVAYSFSKKKFSTMWPLVILRLVASFVVTVLFLPITETLMAIV